RAQRRALADRADVLWLAVADPDVARVGLAATEAQVRVHRAREMRDPALVHLGGQDRIARRPELRLDARALGRSHGLEAPRLLRVEQRRDVPDARLLFRREPREPR